ncbi:MAG: hypothetical protein H3C41_04720 [Bacteroidales bacterium]|nr:hypothetical protein [Bacteroidales bacterium]
MNWRGRITVIFLLVMVMFSCKKGSETYRFFLSEEELLCLPYAQGDSLRFEHSGGFRFSFVVAQKKLSMERSISEHPGDNYFSYEQLFFKLQSVEPELNINFTMTPERAAFYRNFSFNRQSFPLDFPSLQVFDSLMIAGTTFREVSLLVNPMPKAGLVEADTIFLNRSHGILKISMSNGENYHLLP